MIVINEHFPDFLNTGYKSFSCDRFEIDGLVKLTDDKASFLAVDSRKPKQGNFINFLNWLKDNYKQVEFKEIMNGRLAKTLAKNGFNKNHVETSNNMLWLSLSK